MTESPALDPATYRANLIRSVPLLLAVPIVIVAIIVIGGSPFRLGPLLAGIAGWTVALVLRAPVALVAMRAMGGDRERAQPVIVLASGPAEEIVRLVVLVIVGMTLSDALWIGLGWATIEVVYSLVNGAAMLALMGRTDPEAEQARAMLPLAEAMRGDAPLWGVVERTWASLLHIGFTLIVAANPLFVVFTIVVHSATNVLLLRLAAATSLARMQLFGAAWATIVMAVAAALWH
jgi:hypothetical protein